MLTRMLHESLVILDFETTGLSPEQGDRITEVGLVRVEGDHITGRYSSLVNCGVRVPSFISAYTGITQDMVDGAPTVGVVLREMLTFVGESAIVAHGAQFDQRFFANECRHASLPATALPPFLCSLQLARRVHPTLSCHSLGSLAYRLKLPVAGLAHRASADAEVTAELMLSLVQKLGDTYPGVVIDADLLRRLMHSPLAITTAGTVAWAPVESLPLGSDRFKQAV